MLNNLKLTYDASRMTIDLSFTTPRSDLPALIHQSREFSPWFVDTVSASGEVTLADGTAFNVYICDEEDGDVFGYGLPSSVISVPANYDLLDGTAEPVPADQWMDFVKPMQWLLKIIREAEAADAATMKEAA